MSRRADPNQAPHPLLELMARYRAVFGAAWKSRAELAGPKRLADEVAFLPAALSLQETPLHPAPHRFAFAIMALFAIVLLWAILARIDIVAVAPGRIVVSERTKLVQPLERSVVKAVLVRDGDHVAAGQPLVELDPTSAQADKSSALDQIRANQSEVLRARALARMLRTTTGGTQLAPASTTAIQTPSATSSPTATPPEWSKPWADGPGTVGALQWPRDWSAAEVAAEETRLQAEWRDIQARLARLGTELSRRQAEIATARELLGKLEATVPLALGRETDFKKLVEQGYVVDNPGDLVRERPGEGRDTVRSAISYTLAADLENLTLTGEQAIDGQGNQAGNVLIGNAANNTLRGSAADDAVAAELVKTLVVYARGTPVQGIWPTMEVHVGGALVFRGSVGSSEFAAYTMGLGSGRYASSVDVSFTNDAFRPAVGQDRNLYVDRIVVNGRTISAAGIGALFEPALGEAALDGALSTGALTRNGSIQVGLLDADLLDGGAGADLLVGGFGNDVYIVDNPDDRVQEGPGVAAGHDIVRASVDYTLGDNLEDLELTGTGSVNATGNAARNTLRGNAGANRLDGAAGRDVLVGGAGDDVYIVDNAGDIVVEAVGEGHDAVHASVSLVLGGAVEELVLTGTGAINATGNADDNTLTGNAQANRLDGRGGADTLAGGLGNDSFLFGRGYGADVITENDSTPGNVNRVLLQPGITPAQLWWRRVADALEVGILGTSDKLHLSNWYLGEPYQVERFTTSGGRTLLNSQVQNLVNAMAAFSPSAAGVGRLPASYVQEMNALIAANWH